ncbi:MAG: hypothetical protein QOD24_1313 [Solirubrobacteraceae bacterium]|nr:hypothetical protein [Solirubrobacteraceae bacterium]
MKRAEDTVPGLTDGAMTSVAMWLEALWSSSSQVRKTAVPPARYSALPKTFGRNVDSHVSPVFTLQSCMSLQRSGVTKVKRADRFGVEPSGTSCVWQLERTFV